MGEMSSPELSAPVRLGAREPAADDVVLGGGGMAMSCSPREVRTSLYDLIVRSFDDPLALSLSSAPGTVSSFGVPAADRNADLELVAKCC